MIRAAALALVAAAAPALAQDAPTPSPGGPVPLNAPTYLGYAWKGVSSATYRVVTVDTSRTTPEGGVAAEETKRVELEISLTPAGTEGTATWIEVRYLREKLELSPGGLAADSTLAENPAGRILAPVSAVYAAVRDRKIRVLMTPGARLRKVEGVADLVAAARGAFPQGWPSVDEALALMLPVSDATVAGQVASIFLYLPGTTTPADFKRADKIPSPTGAGELDRKFEVLGAESVEGRRQVVARQMLEGNALPAVAVASQAITVETERYSSVSTVWLDAERGIPSRVVTRSERIQTARPAGDGSAVRVPTRIESTTTIEATRIDGSGA